MSPDPEHLFVKPARKGLCVPMPERSGQFLPEEGARVRSTSYWLRALRRGDVELAAEKDRSRTRAAATKEER